MATFTVTTSVGMEEIQADAFVLDQDENLRVVKEGGETVAAFSRGSWVSIVKEEE